MGRVSEFGIGFETLHAREFVRHAKLAEDSGFGTFWVPEDPFWRGAFATASAIACGTSRIKVGIGVLNPYTRSPALTAMEFAALEEVSGGRGVLGIGAGLRDWIEGRLKIPYTRPTAAMRESIEIVRGLFRGERLNYRGRVFQPEQIRLSFAPPRAEIPIHLGVMGPKNLEMAGECGDGVLLSVTTSPAYLQFAMEHLRRGLRKAGRDESRFAVGAYLIASIDENERAARDAVRPVLAMLISLMAPQPEVPILKIAGLDADTIRAFGASLARGEIPLTMVTDWMIDTFTIAGSPAHCRERLGALVDGGINAPVFFEVPGVPPEKTLRDVREHLMPHFL
jgi:5,10-methylenetetrahydromethanopterin reductase